MSSTLLVLGSLIANTYVGGGVMAGGDGGVDAQATVEAGYRLDGNLWAHAAAATGVAGDDQGGGQIHQVRAGIEGRTCTAPRGILCAVAGADLGYQQFTWHADAYHMSPDEPHHDLIAVARLGGDIGGEHIRVRPGIETYHLLSGSVSNGAGLIGINLTLGVAYQW